MYKVKYKFKSLRDGIVEGEFVSETPLDLAENDQAVFRALEKDSGSVIYELIELECQNA